MGYDIKFGFATGYTLVFAAFQPSGVGRGIENQPLYEVRPTGYYRAEPATGLEDGDVVLVYDYETVYWEDSTVVILSYEGVFYESEQVYYEGAKVIDYDSTSNDVVNWRGRVVGIGEYTFGSGDVSSIVTNINNILIAQQRVDTFYDEREPAKEVVVIKGL